MVETNAIIPKPYSWYWHPGKIWFDSLLGFVLTLFVPFGKLGNFPPVKENPDLKKMLGRLRNFMGKGGTSGGKAAVTKWRKATNTPIVQINYSVPRKNLLKEWGLYKEPFEIPPETHIPVVIRFPHLNKTEDIDPSSETNDVGCVEKNKLDINDLPSDVPFVIHFYGGGMTIGTLNDADGLELVVNTSNFESKPIIFALAYYSQAPEYPFPVAVEEALTVVSHMLETCPNRRFHISGISAGANLSAVATMELHRRYPGRIASSLICCPFMLPAANTESYYTDLYQPFVPVKYLRWCWRAYLQLDDPEKQEKGLLELDSMKARLDYNSNRKAWEALSGKVGFPARLVDPTIDIPPGLEEQTSAKIVVMSNSGDPLRDDAAELIEKLGSVGANLKHLDLPGSHWTGLLFDKSAYALLVSSWRDILFSDGEKRAPSS